MSRHFHRNLTTGPRFRSPETVTESDESSLSPAAVTAHVAKKPLPRPLGAASHAGTTKAFDKRVRITEQQKAETVQQIMTNPSMSYTDLGEWYKEQYKLKDQMILDMEILNNNYFVKYYHYLYFRLCFQ